MPLPTFLSRFPRFCWHRRGDDGGAAAVEFAIIAPLFILMIAFMVNGGLHLYAHSTIVAYAREAARGVALGYMDQTEAIRFAQDRTKGDLGIEPVVDLRISGRDVHMAISIAKDQMARFAPFANLMPFTVSARITMRQVQ